MTKKLIGLSVVLLLLAFCLTPLQKAAASLGYIGVWYDSESSSIGRWSASSIKVYMEKVNTNSSFFFTEAINHGASAWGTALGINLPTNTNAPASKIRYFGGTFAELAVLGFSISTISLGATFVTGCSYEGTWVLATDGSTKDGYLYTEVVGFVVDKNRSLAQYKNTGTHELGHALGWRGHSSLSSDIMYPAGSSIIILTYRDIDHLSQVY